jgi:hypothetical protein
MTASSKDKSARRTRREKVCVSKELLLTVFSCGVLSMVSHQQ